MPASSPRRFCFPLFVFAAICATTIIQPTLAAEANRPPNVVLIVADDLGAMDLGCYGSKFHRTPNLDRLAVDGVRFTEAYAACCVCSPTRAALLTGKSPARLHITDWLPGRADNPRQKMLRPELRKQLPLEETTLAELLKGAGYATGHVGKWHLGGKGFSPLEQGFDVNVAGDDSGTPRSYFAPFGHKQATMPGLEKSDDGEYLTDRLASEAEKFIEERKDKPFFLYCPHYAVHTPMKAKQEMIAKYAQDFKFGRQSNPIYAAMLESLDDAVGRIVKKLDDLKLLDDTLIVFTSDNGGLATIEGPNTPATINSPLREGKGFLYEGGIRVPLLVHQPGKVKPGTSKSPVMSQDVFATILAACGVAPPEANEGTSFVSLLEGKEEFTRGPLVWHYPHYSNQGGKPGGAIRDGDFKLIEFYENGRRELFNVRADASESRNLSAEKPELVQKLAEQLDAWRKKMDAQTMKPNPNYTPNPQADDGVITMHASTAEVFGVMLRYEPLPHKNTLGFWVNANDYAVFEFTVNTPGTYIVEPWQGCGGGNGGSVVNFSVGDQSLEMTVEETGGFQNFKPREIGEFRFDKPGRYSLAVKPKTKAKAAVMDVRQIVLKPKK